MGKPEIGKPEMVNLKKGRKLERGKTEMGKLKKGKN